ncbi:Retinal-binding protein [Mytilus edulis]|uniref:Retinal-binding protein n=1 Tax=Mytilus edulis TaxID=6550 RepID=A0A8S3TLH3_MYTED|nr:Retinal-binding protein [Mytilus edulis]
MSEANDNTNNNYKKKPLTAKEEHALLQFKELTKDVADQINYDLEKFLRARCFDVKKAEQMLRNSVEFRKTMKVNTLLKEYKSPEVMRKYLTGGFCGHAKDGSPIRVELFGNLDLKGLMRSTKKSDFVKNKLHECEWTVSDWAEQSKKLGRPVDGMTVICDMADIGTSALWIPGIKLHLHLVKVLEDNYPEMLKRLLVINAPLIFPLLHKIARPLLSEDTRQKLYVKGDNYKDLLLSFIDAENLPACYGGTLTDPDGNANCTTMICQGGPVPEEFYFDNADLKDQMESVTVPRAGKIYIGAKVDRSLSVLSWEFQTEDHDIEFGLFYEENEKYIPIIPVTRADSHVVTHDGTYTCEKVGKYFLCFDNEYSWTRSKQLRYTCEVYEPDQTMFSEDVTKLMKDGDVKTLTEKFKSLN